MDRVKLYGAHVLAFFCPACHIDHQVRVGDPPYLNDVSGWGWNGSMEYPTLSPSILVRSGHFDQGRASKECWCTYNAQHASDPSGFHCLCCHSFVHDGEIEFLSDCQHALRGKTVPLPEYT